MFQFNFVVVDTVVPRYIFTHLHIVFCWSVNQSPHLESYFANSNFCGLFLVCKTENISVKILL